jgi:hypothetical protein
MTLPDIKKALGFPSLHLCENGKMIAEFEIYITYEYIFNNR